MPATPHRDQEPTVVRLASPRDVLDAIPHSLGFVPSDSIVIVLMRESDQRGQSQRRRTVLTMRIDLVGERLPAASLMDWPSIASAVRSTRATSSLMAVFVDTEPAGLSDVWSLAVDRGIERDLELRDLPSMRAYLGVGCTLDEQGELMRNAGEVLAESGAALSDALVVIGGRYFSLMCEDESCCPALGTPYDPAGPGVAGVRLAVEGSSSPFRGRAILEDRFATDPALRAQIEACAGEPEPATNHVTEPDVVAAGVAGVLAAAAHHCHNQRMDPRAALQVLHSLRSVHIRDAVLARAVERANQSSTAASASASSEPASSEAALRDYVSLLTRAAPDDLRAAPATMAALLWWVAGDGASANIALEQALIVDPQYRLALLMAQVVRSAVPPEQVRTLLITAA